MTGLEVPEAFERRASRATSWPELAQAIEESSTSLGFRYFALMHHVSPSWRRRSAIRLHNYPSAWERFFDAQELGSSDPIHRASHLASMAFCWSDVPHMITLSPHDLSVLARARLAGIGDGITVPAHVPGETIGSCSFATEPGMVLPPGRLLQAHLLGSIAFSSARRILKARHQLTIAKLDLTDRERDCVLLVSRGKTDLEIGLVLGISRETVIKHLKHARRKCDAQNRVYLAMRALFDGQICLTDALWS